MTSAALTYAQDQDSYDLVELRARVERNVPLDEWTLPFHPRIHPSEYKLDALVLNLGGGRQIDDAGKRGD